MNILSFFSFKNESFKLKNDNDHKFEFNELKIFIEDILEINFPEEKIPISYKRFDLVTKTILGINSYTKWGVCNTLNCNISNADLLKLGRVYIQDCILLQINTKNFFVPDIKEYLKNKFRRVFSGYPESISFFSYKGKSTYEVVFMINPLRKINENYQNQNQNLIIVDIQKSFSKFYTKKYLIEVNKYAKTFDNVYQIFDNHFDGKNPDLDYLYDENPNIENKNDIYKFNNQKDCIEKRYVYNVNVDFFKKILSDNTYQNIKQQELNKTLKVGSMFNTTEGTIIVYIANNHKWMHLGKKLISLYMSLKGKSVTFVGGSGNECLDDLFISAKSFGINAVLNNNYVYTATNCPIK